MKAFLVARKSLVEILREPQLPGMVLGLPIIFLLMTLLMYNSPILATYPLLIFDPSGKAESLANELRQQRYDNGDPVFELIPVEDLKVAEAKLVERDASLLLKFGPDGKRIILRGDALSSSFYRASVFAEKSLREIARQQAGRPVVVQLVTKGITARQGRQLTRQKQFDLYAPGMILFALLMIIPQTAMLVSREVRWHTLDRIRLTAISSGEFLGGICLAQLLVAACQVVTITLLASAFGFHNRGSLWLAVLAGLAISLGSIALGLIVAAFVENDSQAANLGASVSMLLVFLSGAWFAMPAMTLFSLEGHPIDLFDIFPATSGFLAMQQVLAFGASIREISFRLGVTIIQSGIYLWIGVIVFRMKRMKRI